MRARFLTTFRRVNRSVPSQLLRVFRLLSPALIAGSACYEYHAASIDDLHAGQRVRVVLNRSGTDALAQKIGPGAASLGGRVVARSPADLTLALTEISRTTGREEFLEGETLNVPRSSADRFAVRSVDVSRTALIVVALVAGVAAGQILATPKAAAASSAK